MSLKRVFLLLAFASISFQMKAQEIDPSSYSNDAIVEQLLGGMNAVRWKSGVDSMMTNDILTKAAMDLAERYSTAKKITIEEGFAGDLNKKYKGTTKVKEVSVDIPGGKAKTMYTYAQVAADAVDKMAKGKKFEDILKNPKFYYCGIGSFYNEDNKKVYITVVFGGVDAFNNGVKYRKTLPIPFSKSRRGLYVFDEKTCKQCEKFPDIDELLNSVKIENGKVYLEYGNFKKLKKYFRGAKDGLAVDFVLKDAYPCSNENITDHNLSSKGYMLKPMYQAKLFKVNENNKLDPKNNTYKGAIAKIPSKYVNTLNTAQYEINLIYIVDKVACKTITRSYLEDGGASELIPLTIYPDTLTMNDPKKYQPKSENQELEFVIYFEQGKATYDTKDIEGFLKALNQPDFIVSDITIDAHSSLEGDSLMNAKLQQSRAKSIVDALGKYQKKEVNYVITTSDSWEMFKDSVKKTEYKNLTEMSKEEVKGLLKGEMLTNLEPYLSKERFAKIVMKVTFDLKGKNEQKYVYNSYKKALEKKDVEQAKRISRYIVEKIVEGKYDAQPFLDIELKQEPPYANLNINKMYIDARVNHEDSIYPALVSKLDEMNKTMSGNNYVAWNNTMAFVKTGTIVNNKEITTTQATVNGLYNGVIPQKMNDALNLEWQFKVIEKVDTLDPGVLNPTLQASMDRIKKIFNLEESNWENSLKLAYIFIKHNDLAYSMKLLAPYVTDENPDEQLLFTYISVASHFPDQIYSRNFRLAMAKASAKNKTRYCGLFGNPKLSFQIMDNPLIKKQYCETCN